MLEAIERHDEALRRLALLEAEERHGEAAGAAVERLGRSLARLCDALTVPFAGDDLLETLARARTAVQAAEETARRARDHATARRGAETQRAAARAAVADLTAAGVALAEEQRTLAPLLGLSPDAAIDDLETALSVWSEVDARLAVRSDAEVRIARAAAVIAAFDEEAGRLAARVAPDLAVFPAVDQTRRLAERLADARSGAQRRQELAARLQALGQDLEQAETAIVQAERARTRLLDDIGLPRMATSPDISPLTRPPKP